MDLIKERFPSKQEIVLLFFICLIPVHIWAYIIFFYDVPAYILRMGIWDILGILAYIQVVALVESFIFLLGWIFVNITLPTRFFRDKFLPMGVVLMIITFFWIMILHYQETIIAALAYNMSYYQIFVLLWIIAYFAIIVALSILIRRSQQFEEILCKVPEKFSPLAILYLALDAVAIVFLAIRFIG